MSILKPKIVFDINEEWNVSRLSDIGIKVKEKNKNYKYDQVLTNSASQGVVLQSDYFEKSIANTNNINGYYVVRVNDFVYNPRISNDAPVGPISRNTLTDGVMSPLYTVFRVKSINLEFLDQYFKSNHWHRYMKSVANYGARHDRMAISSNDFINLPIKHPSLPEQQKIADFLTAVDKRIELLEKKKTLLETYKKGVMNKVFSQEIRFKDDDGNDFPDWEERRLGDVSECLDNQRKPLNDSERQNMKGDIPYWGANNIMDYINEYIFNEPIVLLAEDGGNFNDFKDRPIANYYSKKCWVNNHTHVLKGKKDLLDTKFLFFSVVHKNIIGFVSGGTRSKLTKSEMLKIPLGLPCVMEQKKISEFLSSIDNQIELLESQIDKSKTWKKGLLQKMFV